MRIRITFAKNGALRYIGHLDLHKMWERVTRRAGLSLAYSQGFHPSPKIQLAAALPLGFSSRCELVDLWVEGETDLARLPNDLQEAVPPGLRILSVEAVEEKSPPLQTQILSAEFEAVFPGDKDSSELEKKLATVLQADTLPRERRGKSYDLRPLIEELKLLDPDSDGRTHLFMRLSAREGATGRPEEVLDALGLPLDGIRTERTRLIFKENV
jgi:radical SAM-linked protein